MESHLGLLQRRLIFYANIHKATDICVFFSDLPMSAMNGVLDQSVPYKINDVKEWVVVNR